MEAINFFQAPEDVTVVGLVAADPITEFEAGEWTGEPTSLVRIQVALLKADGRKYQLAFTPNVEMLRIFDLAGADVGKIVG